MELTVARLKERLKYDPDTGLFTWIMSPNWSIKVGSIAGSYKDEYVRITIDGKPYLAHRLAWFYQTNTWPKDEIDHKDLNKHNNEWSNLRPATKQQNRYNTLPHSNNTLGLKGVSLHSCGKFQAAIRVNKKKIYLGLYSTSCEASKAYQKALTKYAGEYAR